MSFASPCFKKSKPLTDEDIRKLKELPWNMKIVHTLMRIQEFYILHKGKIVVVVNNDKASDVLLHLAKSKYPSIASKHGTISGIFHGDEGFNPILIWNEIDLDKYIESYFQKVV